MIKNRKKACSVCDSDNLVTVLELPNFPFTGIFLSSSDVPRYRGIDQEQMLCGGCGHGQLKNILDPGLVYDDTYFHRSSASPIATRGNDFFAKFLEKISGGRRFQRILEIGCNDFYLLKKIEPLGERLFGVDPIWRGREPRINDKIKIIGKFVEEVDFEKELEGNPDLVISAHTFEHVENPKGQLKRVMQDSSPDVLFVIEVPGFDSLLVNNRFDQVFHQHIQYFSLASFEKMIYEIGGEYLDHTFNYGYWGGTMLVAFKKRLTRKIDFQSRFPAPYKDLVCKHFQMFQAQINQCLQSIQSLKDEPIYGYGAAQMLPALAYHLRSDFSFMKCVLDDNSDRHGLMYPYMPIVIQKPTGDFTLEGANVLITALDSLRPILKRVLSLQAKRVLVPLNIF